MLSDLARGTILSGDPCPSAMGAALIMLGVAAVLFSGMAHGRQAGFSRASIKHIVQVAGRSSCARHYWRGRGRAPVGYIEGVALTYSKSYCEATRSDQSAAQMMEAPLGNPSKDALAYYHFLGSTANDRLREVYTLGIGVGMRESSGVMWAGYDKEVKHPTSVTAEAGLFQTSYDSLRSSPSLRKLWKAYQNDPVQCNAAIFARRVRRTAARIIGGGLGAEYQRFTKACPSFAVEYAMVLLRVNRHHFGSVNRREAEWVESCNVMLQDLEPVLHLACGPLLAQKGRIGK